MNQRKITPDLIAAIDPGANGAIAHYFKSDHPKTVGMPKEESDLHDYLRHLRTISQTPLLFLERVNLMGQDMTGGKAFRIQQLLGQFERIKTALRLNRIPYIEVYPATWQSELNLIKRTKKGEEKETNTEKKNRHKEMASRIFPDIPITHQNADALLILEFGVRKLIGDPTWIQERLPKQAASLFPKEVKRYDEK